MENSSLILPVWMEELSVLNSEKGEKKEKRRRKEGEKKEKKSYPLPTAVGKTGPLEKDWTVQEGPENFYNVKNF